MSRKYRWKLLKTMVALGRVELPTFGLGNRCSIHLSYRARELLRYFTSALQRGPVACTARSVVPTGLAHILAAYPGCFAFTAEAVTYRALGYVHSPAT